MSSKQQQQSKGAFELIEEAVHLLRTAPAPALASYYFGAIPFVIGWLYFWSDMSRSPFAESQLGGWTLGMAVLFLWMKIWQVIFARRLRAHLAAESMPRWTVRRLARTILIQTFVQPTGLFLIPISVFPILPAAWVYAFYQNATVLDSGDPGDQGMLVKKSWKQATLRSKQNVLVLAIVAAFGFYVFLNWVMAGVILPHLIKMLFGIESVFTRSTFSMLNTTLFAGAAGLTYLCVDPIVKAVYTLRCFYGESLSSGEDLRAGLNSISIRGWSLAIISVLASMVSLLPVKAADDKSIAASPASVQSASPSVKPADLNQAINETIHEDKYTWRMPRGKAVEADADEGAITRFFERIGSTLRQWAHSVSRWLDEWLRKLSWRPSVQSGSRPAGYGWMETLQVLLYGLVAVVVIALAVLAYRIWRDRQLSTVIPSEPIPSAPDMNDENIGADHLPEDGWSRIARELLERGELRLALRAYYFASLSHLAARNLIHIARFKSNHEYERELRRRGHSYPELVLMFGDNLLSFERVWYGLHEVNRELVDRFADTVERMRATG